VACCTRKLSIMLIGERPGLSAPDSLGVYITWNPRPGRTDAERNCISNIRHEGLTYVDAAQRIAFYMNEAKRLQATGITLKENISSSLPGTLMVLETHSLRSSLIGLKRPFACPLQVV
jgi:hypothetical protein